MAVAAASRRDRILIAACIALIALTAWLYLAYLHRRMSSQMSMVMSMPWMPADIFFTFGMWAIMMVAMMTAPAAPVVMLFAGAQARRSHRRLPLATLTFLLGYVLVWFGFSACAALAQYALHQASLLSPAMKLTNPHIGGAVLVAAGIYQLTPLKGACLTQCRSPLGFLMSHWHEGSLGALRMGTRHGAYCLGCCWALMCVLFLVGVMNLAWVAAVSVFVLVEKIGPAGVYVARAGGVVMIVVGVFVTVGT